MSNIRLPHISLNNIFSILLPKLKSRRTFSENFSPSSIFLKEIRLNNPKTGPVFFSDFEDIMYVH